MGSYFDIVTLSKHAKVLGIAEYLFIYVKNGMPTERLTSFFGHIFSLRNIIGPCFTIKIKVLPLNRTDCQSQRGRAKTTRRDL